MPTVRLSIPAKPEYLVLGRLALTGISRTREIDPDSLSDLKLALTEACTNSILHGYQTSSGYVHITYEIGEGYLAVEVRDEGVGFTPGAPEELAEELDRGGLGLEIIRALSDETTIDHSAGSGSALRFVKRLS